jgi:hypothetical protein
VKQVTGWLLASGRKVVFGGTDALRPLLDAVVEHEAPWGYLELLIADVGGRNQRARLERLVEMLVEDLAQAKWLTDPAWQERVVAAAAARRRAERAAQYAEFRDDAAILEEAGPSLVDAWRRHLTATVPARELAMLGDLDRLVADELRGGLVEPPMPEDSS